MSDPSVEPPLEHDPLDDHLDTSRKEPLSSRRRRWMRRALAGGVATLALGFLGLALVLVGAWFAFPLPKDMLHPGPAGALVLDAEGGVLLDTVASDDQRRLPIRVEDAGPWIPAAVIAVEDASFRSHPGIDLPAILESARANLAAGRIVRGGSTITMQVAGLRLGHPRTFPGKAVEAFRALQIEAAHDKDRILEAWLNIAPFGGNLVGVEAASRGWFGKAAHECTLAEAALLAGLPNAPERFRPDRHPEAAVHRRRVVLDRMLAEGIIGLEDHAEAVASPLLVRRRDLVRNERHAGWMAIDATGRGRVVDTTIAPSDQAVVETIVDSHAERLPAECDIAVVLVDTETAEIRALVGSSDPLDPRDGRVNGAIASRSPGSALKPFIYAAAFEDGRLAPDSIVDDAPADFAGWRPRNIDRQHLGRVTAAEALRTSRNLPALLIARDLGPRRVESSFRSLGLRPGPDAIERAGLSLAVGGLEVRPLDLAEAYATLARGGVHRPLRLLAEDPASTSNRRAPRVFSEATCAAIEACLAGPATETSASLPFVAAKTGTSSGHRDAVAAGWNRRWTATVWVGRFDGAADPALLGADAALPILQDLLLHPRFATARSPRPFEAWSVVEDRAAGRLGPARTPAIRTPVDGAVLLAIDGRAVVRPEIEHGPAARLFVNGAPADLDRIVLDPGRHELRVVEAGRPPHAIAVEVVTRP